MLKDLATRGRLLLHAKGWTTVVVLSLALGIGANTAHLQRGQRTAADQMPVKDPDSLVRLRCGGPQRHGDRARATTASSRQTPTAERADDVLLSDVPAVRRRQPDDERICSRARRSAASTSSSTAQAEIAPRSSPSGNYYRVLGVDARLGRTIVPDDDRPDAPPVAVISSQVLAHRASAAIPAVVGKTSASNNVPVTIVGVLSPEFTGVQQPVDEPPDISLPLALDSQLADLPAVAARRSRPTGGCR